MVNESFRWAVSKSSLLSRSAPKYLKVPEAELAKIAVSLSVFPVSRVCICEILSILASIPSAIAYKYRARSCGFNERQEG